VYEVEIDEQQRGRAGLLGDNVVIPHFFDNGSGHWITLAANERE
jgi:hypothetical protein